MRYELLSSFPDEKMEAQRSSVAYPRLRSWEVELLGFEPK